ncbi:MAG TPA: carbohydrate-binding protein [Vicinamibacterales bacterium]|nr:carbohydrate-binding protein [Vicinamibacterales bacterium]
MTRRLVSVCSCALLFALSPALATAAEVIIRASSASTVRGNWHVVSDGSAAGGQYLASNDYGWSTTSQPQASPVDYFEVSFNAPAGSYHVWLRLRASGNSKYNESIWVQYSDATNSAGSAIYRIGTTSGLLVNLERCNNCGVSGWGWQDGAYWLSQTTTVKFATTGSHKIRVQTREDGVQIDQIVLSSDAYLHASPGQLTNDRTIVSDSSADTSSAAGPYLGNPVALPGRVEAENFDKGADGVAYHDTTRGNTGGVYRATSNADIERSSEGGYNLGWISGGEWANYSVRVGTAGSYKVRLRVASPGGGSLHVGFNGPSSVWKSVSVPATGGWQAWRTVEFTASLGAGSQLLTLAFDTGGFNLNYVEVVSGTTTTTTTTTTTSPSTAPSTTTGGTTLNVATWNIHYNSAASHAQRTMDYLMNQSPRPTVVVLQEALRSQYNTYLSQLQSRTGQTWRGVFLHHCPLGAWNGSSCTATKDEGVAVLTSLSVSGSSSTHLPYRDAWHSARALVRLQVSVGGVVTQVFGTHLQPNDPTARYNSMRVLKSYASNYSKPQLVAGDFNADPDQIDSSSGMRPNFVETWAMVGSGSRYTAFTPSPNMKIDYWFTDAGLRARPTSSRVLTGAGTMSDHFPVVASFSVR